MSPTGGQGCRRECRLAGGVDGTAPTAAPGGKQRDVASAAALPRGRRLQDGAGPRPQRAVPQGSACVRAIVRGGGSTG
eukprot:1938689-Pyramimonas_sp.AAC.1